MTTVKDVLPVFWAIWTAISEKCILFGTLLLEEETNALKMKATEIIKITLSQKKYGYKVPS